MLMLSDGKKWTSEMWWTWGLDLGGIIHGLHLNSTYIMWLLISYRGWSNAHHDSVQFVGHFEYCRFAAALHDLQIDCWVMNVVPVSGFNTLPVIYDRGLIGAMHDWYRQYTRYYILGFRHQYLSINHKIIVLILLKQLL